MIARLLITLIKIYQVTLSPLFSTGACRFTPGCSSYAVEAFSRHGSLKGTWLTLMRLCRCHPWGGHGADPVP